MCPRSLRWEDWFMLGFESPNCVELRKVLNLSEL